MEAIAAGWGIGGSV